MKTKWGWKERRRAKGVGGRIITLRMLRRTLGYPVPDGPVLRVIYVFPLRIHFQLCSSTCSCEALPVAGLHPVHGRISTRVLIKFCCVPRFLVYWRLPYRCSVPSDDQLKARWARVSNGLARRLRQSFRSFNLSEGEFCRTWMVRWHHPRCRKVPWWRKISR